MKESLYAKLASEIDQIDERIKQLKEHIILYKKNDDFEGAMKNDLKCRQLEMVSKRLKNLLI